MNDINHLKDNLSEANKALPNMLTNIEKTAIKKVDKFYKARIQVDCTDCKYCMPCPYGINIPGNFAFYNNAHVFNDKDHFKTAFYNQMKPEQMANMCQKCEECLAKCPQNIQIIDELEKVAEYFKK
jgi:predicted aldo/keto reductase-like oxidoreductase